MENELKIKIRTPIWTGGYEGRPKGLKMSGVLGGMRAFFEMLVRKHGGKTCDITSDNSSDRCNYDDNANICPVCALFGCTGLSKAFKIVFPDNEGFHKAIETIPEKDSEIPNRKHNGEEYRHPVEIAKWIGVCAGLSDKMRTYNNALSDLANRAKISVYYPANEIDLKILPLRKTLKELTDEDTFNIIKYLLYVMSVYHGLGAKVHQGWGIFEIKDDNIENIKDKGFESLKKLITKFNQFHPAYEYQLPTANDLYMYEWEMLLPYKFSRTAQITGNYLETGYAMRYRLRREIKFFNSDRDKPFYDKTKTSAALQTEWNTEVNKLTTPWSQTVWKDNIPFTRMLFGLDNSTEDNKTAGLVGVSHQFKKEDGKWYVRLYARLPDMIDGLSLKPAETNEFLQQRMKEVFGLNNCNEYKNGEI